MEQCVSNLASFPRWSIEVVRTVVILAIVLAVGSVYQARGDNHDVTYWACLYSGSLSQVGTTQPANCGRGAAISWNAAGVEGLQGSPGISGLTTQSTIFVASTGVKTTQTIGCPDDLVPIGSGYQQAGTNDTVAITGDLPITTLSSGDPYGFAISAGAFSADYGWQFEHRTIGGGTVNVMFQVFCAEVEPPAAP